MAKFVQHLDVEAGLVVGTPVEANVTDADLSGQVGPSHGGTGIDASAAANGKVPIGNGSGFTLATITAGSNITVTNGAGSITIAGTAGTVTSVDVSGGTTGLTFSGGPVTSSGTVTMAGTLGVANGGTGLTSVTAHRLLVGNGTSALATVSVGTAGRLLLDKGSSADPAFVAMSGDATIDSSGVLTLGNNVVTDAKFRQSVAISVVGRAASNDGNVSDIVATGGGQYLRCDGINLAFAAILAADLPTITLTGDVTGAASGGSISTTLANDSVTLAKLANMATASFLGRNTAGTGDPEVLSVATAKTMLSLTGTNSGDISIGGENYLSLAGQAITISAVNLSGTNVTGTLAAGRFPALTGDVTTTAGSLATIIANDSVTLAKMANMATASFLGRNTASTGDPEVLSVATAKTMLSLTGTNSGDVTLTGENYLSIAGQVITVSAVNLSGTNVTGTLAAGRFPALTGDVTTSAGSLATTVAPGAVALAKQASSARPVLNHLINGGMAFAQRQAPGTLTAVAQDGFGADRWRSARENADLQYARVDTNGSLETGLNARFYGQWKKITSAGKILIVQILEGSQTFPLAGRTLTFQARLKGSGSFTARLGLVQLTSSGTIDTVPSALVPTTWGSSGSDPTLGSNLSRVAPSSVPTGGSGTVNGNAVDCSVTTSWALFAGTFTAPSNAKNLMVAVWSNAQLSAGDSLYVGEAQLNDGDSVRDWLPRPAGEELLLCQRYYQKSYAVDTVPGNASDLGPCVCPNSGTLLASSTAGNAGLGILLPFKATMRTAPTVTLYDFDGTANAVRVYPADAKRSGVTAVSNVRDSGCAQFLSFDNSSAQAIAANSVLNAHFAASAEL